MGAPPQKQITQMLVDWGKGDGSALEKLTPLVYDELHLLARRYMGKERPGHPLQTSFKHFGMVVKVAFSPDGRSLATICESDGLVRLWDLATGKESMTLRGHHSTPDKLAFFPDGRRLATGGGDKTVKLWDLETQQEILSVRHTGSQIMALAVSADGRRMASATSNQVKLWLTNDPTSAAHTKTERLRELTRE